MRSRQKGASGIAAHLVQRKRRPSAEKLARGQIPKTSQIGGVHRRTARPIYARSIATPDYRKLIGAFNGAEQIRPLGPWRGAGAISGRRFPRDLAWNLCALRGDRCADSAGRAEILERRSAGSLRHTNRRAAAAFPRSAEGEGLSGAAFVVPAKAGTTLDYVWHRSCFVQK